MLSITCVCVVLFTSTYDLEVMGKDTTYVVQRYIHRGQARVVKGRRQQRENVMAGGRNQKRINGLLNW
jgi:hypothetical protein